MIRAVLYSVGPNMQVNRMAHYFVSLPDGKVALVGGHWTDFVALNTTEIFDPQTNSFVNLLQMNSPRDGSAVVKLKDGRYLIAGGAYDSGGAPGYDTAEIFKPADYSFTPVKNLKYARTKYMAQPLRMVRPCL